MSPLERLRRRWWASLTSDTKEELRELRRFLGGRSRGRFDAVIFPLFLIGGGFALGGVAAKSLVAMVLGFTLLFAVATIAFLFLFLYLFVLLCGEPIRRWALRRSPYGGGRHG